MPLDLPHPKVLTGNGPLVTCPRPPAALTTLPQLFRHQKQQLPDKTAFSCRTNSGELQTLTYAEDAIASQAARRLAQWARRSDDESAPVLAIWLEKGLDLILSILATTHSGATWLPFDPDVPVERAAVCVADAGATVLISDDAHGGRAEEVQERTRNTGLHQLRCCTFQDLIVSTPELAGASDGILVPLTGPQPGDAAYIIMTSGTTGTPKGIAISHSAALTFSLSEQLVLKTAPTDIVWNGFSAAFDMFVEEVWVTIAGGAHLAIGTRAECTDVPKLPTIWAERGVTVVNAVPTLIGIMDLARSETGDSSLLPQSVRLINLGGEACPPALVGRLARPDLRVLNTYGPTETTVTATWDELQPDTAVTIGKPLPGYHACLLAIEEDGGQPTTEPLDIHDGVEGELAIGGPCVSMGYIGRRELTAQKFIQHPLAPNSGERLYRTGDRVRLQSDHKIVFPGRIDTQVKHRGFRIELGEIESRLYDVPGVQAAAVVLANAGSDSARLEAFVVVRSDVALHAASLQALAFQQLPAYMRPEEVFFLQADEMPSLPSGKINAKALHDISSRRMAEEMAAQRVREESCSTLVPGTELDSELGILLGALKSVFPQADHIKPDADIFDDLGGHSLLIAMLVSRLRKARCKLDGAAPFAAIGLADVYEGRTPAAIAARFSLPEKYTDDGNSAELPTDSEDLTEGESAYPREPLPVSQTKFVLCGLAQLVPILFLCFVHAVEMLTPYLLFDYFTLRGKTGWAILSTYGVFVAIPPCQIALAVGAKWLLLGKVKPGEYPLYETYYFRRWFAERLAALVNDKLVADSPLYPFLLRAMGARVGNGCHIGALNLGACGDLVHIGDDVVIGPEANLAVRVVEGGRLILKEVAIHNGALISSSCVVEGGARIGAGAELAPLSCVADGMEVPAFQRYHGSPARFEREVRINEAGQGRRARPGSARALAVSLGHLSIATLVLPLLHYLPQIPGLLLFDYVHLPSIGEWGQVAVLSIPIAVVYLCLVFVQLLACQKLLLGRLEVGTYKVCSFWYLRKWLVDRAVDMALTVLHPVFGTLYIVPFLRLLGMKIGKRAELSAARRMPFQLLETGDESFVADAVVLGSPEVRADEITLKKTTIDARAFAGNASVLPQGTTLASGTLLGVLSIAPTPDKSMAKNSSCFGSPVLLPNRQRADDHDEALLFRPSRACIAARLSVEFFRIVLPRAVIVFGLGFSTQLADDGYSTIGAVHVLLMLPLFYFFMFAFPALLVALLLKWTLIGRYQPAEWPLWSPRVWISEAVTSTWQTLTVPLLASMLLGTPYLAPCLRFMGVEIGSRATLLASDFTEYDCVTIGDEAALNTRSAPQTHLFEDRVMKVGRVALGRQACLKPGSICLSGGTVSDSAQLGSLSLVMKNECLPEGTAWEGAPVRPRQGRRPRREKADGDVCTRVVADGKTEKGM